MSWLTRYRIRLYLHNSIWPFPSLSVVAGLSAVALLSRVERAFGWEMNVSVETHFMVPMKGSILISRYAGILEIADWQLDPIH